ncbi:MAG: polysaccharide deacetylase family protein [Wolinella sp.]
MRSVPVLMYHHVLPSSGFIASSAEQFEAQMSYLAKKGYKCLSSDEFASFKLGNYEPPKRSVVITFDDGWRDNYVYAYPILKKYGLRAILFVVTEWIEEASRVEAEFEPLGHNDCKKNVSLSPRSVLLNWHELEAMRDVFDVHSHTHTHRDSYFPGVEWHEDFKISKNLLRERLGIETKQLCWPRGKYNEGLIRTAKTMGYEMLYTTERGVNLPDKNCDKIKRIAAKNGAFWLAKNLLIFSSAIFGSWYARQKRQ